MEFFKIIYFRIVSILCGIFHKYTYTSTNINSICVANNKEVGKYLVDSHGHALYYYKQDRVGDSLFTPVSNCNESCLTIWQIFYESKFNIVYPLNKKNFTVLNRPGGQKQLVYKGHPIYLYINDFNPGDIKGEGLFNDFYTIKFD